MGYGKPGLELQSHDLEPEILPHRRKKGTESEGKGRRVCFWGTEFVQFFAALAVLPRSVWKNRKNSSYSSKSTEAK